MEIFFTLLGKLIPLYVVIFLGYIAGRFLNVRKESIASLLIYIIAPIIVFHGVATTKLTPGVLSLPLLFFIIACILSLLFLWIGKSFWKDTTKNILAFTAGTGNTGYFGIPVALILFDESAVGFIVIAILGLMLYENSVGFFITARGHHTVKEALIKVVRLPTLYAFFLGVLVQLAAIPFGQALSDVMVSFRGAYSMLGMMMIGLGLASINRFSIDYLFLGLSFLAKFILWPLIMLLVIVFDNLWLRLYTPAIHKVLVLLSIVPLAANTVAFATELKAEPEKAALAVGLSTLFALFYIPLIAVLFL